jgi:hypothetical protein
VATLKDVHRTIDVLDHGAAMLATFSDMSDDQLVAHGRTRQSVAQMRSDWLTLWAIVRDAINSPALSEAQALELLRDGALTAA